MLVFAAASLIGCVNPRPSSVHTRFTSLSDVTFTPPGWPAPLVANTYKPESAAPTPAVLLIHGGGWSKNERRSDMTGIAKDLVRRGYFVMNTTYRLAPEWKFPAQTRDLSAALQYMRSNSRSLNIDPDRIATFGYSAGGHLAALTGLDPRNNIAAIVAGGAPADLRFWPDGQLTGALLGSPLAGNRDIYRRASPVALVTSGSPPVFIYHGTEDETVPTRHPKAFIAALEKNHVAHEVYWLEGRSHIMTHLLSAEAIPKAIDFLDKHMK